MCVLPRASRGGTLCALNKHANCLWARGRASISEAGDEGAQAMTKLDDCVFKRSAKAQSSLLPEDLLPQWLKVILFGPTHCSTTANEPFLLEVINDT